MPARAETRGDACGAIRRVAGSGAWGAGGAGRWSERSAPLLFPLDRFEQGPEVALPETAGAAAALDHLEEEGGAGEDAFREKLQQVAFFAALAVDEDLQLLQHR